MTEIPIPSPELVNIEQLTVDSQNPNRMTPKQHAALADSIRRYGFIIPIITNRNLLIADGEQRWIVAQALGMEQVPVIRLPVQDVDRRLLRQVLNKLRGEHELIADAYEFERIIQMGHEDDLKSLLLLTDSQIERYLSEIKETKEETYIIPEIDKITTNIQRGDIYQLGDHNLMCGDGTAKDDIAALVSGNRIDLMFGDPPYNIGYDVWDKKKDYSSWCLTWFRYYSTLAPRVILTVGLKNMAMWLEIEPEICIGVWYKKNATTHGRISKTSVWEPILFCGDFTGYKSEFDVFEITNKLQDIKEVHKSPKQMELMVNLVSTYSPPRGRVIDPFGGSGSTLIACEQTNRICYMMEIEPKYCQVIINRWEAYTGQKAVKCPPDKPVTEDKAP